MKTEILREVDPEHVIRCKNLWRERFNILSRGYVEDLPLRVLVGCWYVAGILYEGYQEPPLPDSAYDELSKYLLEHLDECHARGSDTLRADDLAAGTAQGWKSFPKPYHDVAAWLCTAKSERKRKEAQV